MTDRRDAVGRGAGADYSAWVGSTPWRPSHQHVTDWDSRVRDPLNPTRSVRPGTAFSRRGSAAQWTADTRRLRLLSGSD